MCLSLADLLTGAGWCGSVRGLTESSVASGIPAFSLAAGFAGVSAGISLEF